MEVRRLYISFIMSKLFSAHDGDMLVGVLNKKRCSKKYNEVLFRNDRMCATRFSTSGIAYLRMTVFRFHWEIKCNWLLAIFLEALRKVQIHVYKCSFHYTFEQSTRRIE